jgi:hypothetical protein
MKDEIKLGESVFFMVESNHLFYSHKEKLKNLLNKNELDRNDVIDIYFSLHLVLELGINNVFRKIITPGLKNNIDTHEMVENLDSISFRDKIVMFIYYSKFNFNEISDATRYHSIINKIKKFSEIRNKLFHGHSISEISNNKGISRSNLREKLKFEVLKKHVEDFKFILEGLAYYIDCLESENTSDGKRQFIKTYLSHDFIPVELNFSIK